MSNESKSPFEKARDKALRALMAQGSLTPEQVSSLKLRQLHLATSTLTVEPDAFAASPEAKQETINLKLDASMQRALIDWLVVRPDGPNDHLFPGTGQTGLEVATIKQVAAEKEPVEPVTAPKARDKTGVRAEKPSDPGAPIGLPEPLPRRPQRPREERPSPPPPPVAQRPKEPEGVSLEEIEALRKRLADAYDAWAPAVAPSQAEPSPKPEAPPPTPIEPIRDRDVPPERKPAPEITRPEEVSTGVPRPPAPKREEAPREIPRPPAPRKEEAPREVPRPSMPRREEAPREVPRPHAPKREEARTEPEEVAAVPAPSVDVKDKVKGLWKSGARGVTLSYRALTAAGVAFVAVFCCVGLSIAAGALLGRGSIAGLVAVATPAETEAEMASPTVALSATPTATGTPSPTAVPSPTFTPPPAPTNTPAPSPTPVIVVVTATPTPEPPPTDTPVPTNTPQGGAPAEPTAPPAPAFKYPAPTLLEPKDGGVVPGSINYFKWEPVGPLADDEWYAVRLIFLQQGQPTYEGDRTKEPVWLVPERLYYKADGPALEYSWFVFVERQNPDGSTSQLSPESKTNAFRWE